MLLFCKSVKKLLFMMFFVVKTEIILLVSLEDLGVI